MIVGVNTGLGVPTLTYDDFLRMSLLKVFDIYPTSEKLHIPPTNPKIFARLQRFALGTI